LGQRHGIGVPSNTDNKAYVVVGKDQARNALVVAFDAPDAPGLWGREFRLRDLQWTNREPGTGPRALSVRPRYRDPAMAAMLELDSAEATRGKLTFVQPQRALAPGQIAALYEGDVLLGGGAYE
jgi:tRNA-specific 2-thiouridylase